MQVTYSLTLDDLLQLSRYAVQRRVGMSLWLLYLCGIILGPVGVAGLLAEVWDSAARHRIVWANVSGSLVCLFLAWVGWVAVQHSPGRLKNRARSRVQQSPCLLQERHLIVVESGLIESAPEGLAHIQEQGQDDAPITEQETERLLRDYAFLTADWNSVTEVSEDKTALYILADPNGFIIPKRIFEDPAGLQRVREHLAACRQAAKSGNPLSTPEAVWPPPPTSRR